MSELSPEVQAIAQTIQSYVNAISDESVLVDQVVVVWEQVRFEEDGQMMRQVNYTVPSENFSLSGAIGLCESGKVLMQRDLLGLGFRRDEE